MKIAKIYNKRISFKSKFKTWNERTKTRTQRLKPKTCKVCKTKVQFIIIIMKLKKHTHKKKEKKVIE